MNLQAHPAALTAVLFFIAWPDDGAAEDAHHEAPDIDAAYVAVAEMRSYTAKVHALEPAWLYQRQTRESFTIEAMAAYVALVTEAPIPVPAKLTDRFAAFRESSPEARATAEAEPMTPPEQAFVVFDAEREPRLLIYLHHGVLIAQRAVEIGGRDTFQGAGDWIVYREDGTLMDYLVDLAESAPPKESPFQRWLGPPRDPFGDDESHEGGGGEDSE